MLENSKLDVHEYEDCISMSQTSLVKFISDNS